MSFEIVVRGPERKRGVDLQERLAVAIGFLDVAHVHRPNSILGFLKSLGELRILK
jgi:hypothetical protein